MYNGLGERKKPQAAHGCEVFFLNFLLACFVLAGAAILNDHWRAGPTVTVERLDQAEIPQPGVDEEVIYAHFSEGEDIWDLARVFTPAEWQAPWFSRVLELNGWEILPDLQPNVDILVPDWRPDEPDIWGTRPPMAYDQAGPGQQVEHLAEGETFADLARIYAPTKPADYWLREVKAINGWTVVPELAPGETFLVPDWRDWPYDIETREKPDGSVELVPIDPYASTGNRERGTGNGE